MDIGGNPSALFDKTTGKLLLQFVRGLLDKKSEAQTCNPATTNWQQESTDSGLTWSKPMEISKALGPWAGSLVGPSNGIEFATSSFLPSRFFRSEIVCTLPQIDGAFF
jgi:hypothetical protein